MKKVEVSEQADYSTPRERVLTSFPCPPSFRIIHRLFTGPQEGEEHSNTLASDAVTACLQNSFRDDANGEKSKEIST